MEIETDNLISLIENTKNHNDSRVPIFNQKYIIQEYQKIIDSSNLEGKLQISIGWLLIILYITSNFIFVLFALNKEYPLYECVSYEEFEDELGEHINTYDATLYKVVERCNNRMAVDCLKKFCTNSENFNEEYTADGADKNSKNTKNKVINNFPPPAHNTFKVRNAQSTNSTDIDFDPETTSIFLNSFNFKPPPAILIHITSIKNFVTDFYLEKNFCEIQKYSTEILRFMMIGKITGIIIFYFITKFIGRKYSIYIITLILIVTNLNFLFIHNRFDFLIVLMILYSTCHCIEDISYVYSIESMTRSLAKSVNNKKVILNSLIGMLYIFLMFEFKNWKILFCLNLILALYSGYLVFHYNFETPKFLLYNRKFRRLKKHIIEISKINSTYEFNVEEMLTKLEKQKRFSKNMLMIDHELREDFAKEKFGIVERKNFLRMENYSCLRVKNFLKELQTNILNFLISLIASDSNVRNFFSLVPVFVLNSSIFVFYYGQLFYIEKIKSSFGTEKNFYTYSYASYYTNYFDSNFQNLSNDSENFHSDLYLDLSYPYHLIFLLFFSEFLAEIFSIKINLRKRNKKTCLCIGFVLLFGLCKILSVHGDLFYNWKIAILVFFLINFILMLNKICIGLYVMDLCKRRFFAGEKIFNIKTLMNLINCFILYFGCYFLFVTQDNPFFVFSLIFVIDSVICFLFF